MADFRLDFSGSWLTGDITRDGPRFAEDGGLETAVLLSLFLDRRANADDEMPDGDDDPRGYWGDAFAEVEGDRFGSRLWLLRRSALTTETLNRAREYVLEALAWLKEDAVASDVRVETEIQGLETLTIGIEIDRQEGGTQRFGFSWDRIGGVVSNAA